MKIRPAKYFHASLITFVSVLLFITGQPGYANEIKGSNGQTLPDISWQDAEGITHHLKDSNGKPRLLHFWAAWCFPCRAELPEMLEWQKHNHDIEIIPLSLDERMTQAMYFIKKYKLDMPPLLIDDDDSDALDIPVLPFTILVSADGKHTGSLVGAASWDSDFTAQLKKWFNLD